MRVAYLVPGPMGQNTKGEIELERRRAILKEYAAAGTEVGIVDVAAGPVTIESVVEEYLSVPRTLRRAVDLEQEHWDALILGCYGDPGLDAIRELVSIPVVGPGEATALTAASLGHRFSIITIAQSIIPALERLVRNAGVATKLASVRAIDIPVLQLHEEADQAARAVLAQGRKAIHEDRADTLILGCMSLGFLGIAEMVSAELEVPVLNPGRVSLKFAEAIVGAGLTHSRRAYVVPPKLASGKVSSALDLLVAA